MPTEEELQAVVFGAGEPWLVPRTLRALERLGIEARLAGDEAFARARGALWLLRAGSAPLGVPRVPPRSATGKPLVAFGATAGNLAWSEVLASSGGDLSRAPALPRIDSVLLERPEGLARRLGSSAAIDAACAALARSGSVRAVRLPSLDVAWGARLSIFQAVTTLQRGGAERIALDLVRELRASHHDVALAVLDRPSRATFDAPDGTLHLYELADSRAARIDALADLAIARGADVLHVHLLDGEEVRRLSRAGIPVVMTVHNAHDGWPAGTVSLGRGDVALLVACSGQVADELRAAGVAPPVRTIWNGITPSPRASSARTELGIGDDALLILAVANHRPQKRLERIAGIVAELRARGRDARAVLVGEPLRTARESVDVEKAVRSEAARLGVEDRISFLGSRADLAPLYAAADAVVSTSAYEGMSLVHLEALAAGRTLVTTHVGGAAELARKHPGLRVVDLEASAATFADAILSEEPVPSALAPDFTSRRTAERHAELFRRVAGAGATRPSAAGALSRAGLVLVANNFSTGGAQSSARRLLVELARAGVSVRAVVIEEQRDYPTPGRLALAQEGIVVHAAPRAGDHDPMVTARDVAAFVDRASPSAVLFWNVISEHKVLLADLLLDVPIWDVSPGEMYFQSLDRYFERPREGVPYLDARAYGRLLAGAIVKYEAERARAADALGVRVEVVPNGVVVPERPIRRTAVEGLVVGTLARISPDKKLEELVEAAAHGQFALRIAGGVEKGSEAYAQELRARAVGTNVTFVGERDAAAFLAEIDLFAMVSEPSGCPNASLEAMASGLAVVATDAGGAREQIVHGETGLVVPRGDARALGEALAELARDPARCVVMGDAGHARVRARFDARRMAADYARICLGLELDSAARAAE